MTDTWFADWFDADYLRVYAARDTADAAAGVRLVHRALRLPPSGGTLLDLACGAGRHLPHLKSAGLTAVGLDLSPTLLHEAARLTGGRVPLVRADMRRLPFAAARFDAVAMFFTSFGYFDEDDNRMVLTEIARVLKPTGEAYIDLLNREHVLANLIPHGTRRVDDIEVDERRCWNPERQRLEKTIELRAPGKLRRITESVRLYRTEEVRNLGADAGLELTAVFGSLAGEPYHPRNSPRLILRATHAAPGTNDGTMP